VEGKQARGRGDMKTGHADMAFVLKTLFTLALLPSYGAPKKSMEWITASTTPLQLCCRKVYILIGVSLARSGHA